MAQHPGSVRTEKQKLNQGNIIRFSCFILVVLAAIIYMIFFNESCCSNVYTADQTVDKTHVFDLASFKSKHKLHIEHTNTACGENPFVCNSVSNPICKYLVTYHTLFQHHHKTGHDLSGKIRNHILNFCGIKDNIADFEDIFLKQLSPNAPIRAFHAQGFNFSTAVLLHFMRSPVNTILSGYYYHLKAEERWLWMRSIEYSTIDRPHILNLGLYQDVIASEVNGKNYFEKYWQHKSGKIKNCFIWQSIFSQKLKDEIIANGFMVNLNMSVHQFYNRLHGTKPYLKKLHGKSAKLLTWTFGNNHKNIPKHTKRMAKVNMFRKKMGLPSLNKRKILSVEKNNDQIGLFWEFVRYFNCEWAYSYLMDQIGSMYFDNYYRFHLDDFSNHKGFDKNINQILNALNIVENEENNQRLIQKGVHLNITKLRNVLFDNLKSEDFSDVRGSKFRDHRRFNHNETQSAHVTKGEYNKEESVKLLLTFDNNTCHIIKNLTIMLRFEWEYEQFC